MSVASFGGTSFGQTNPAVTFGTVINRLCFPDKRGITRITSLGYLPGTTGHTITAFRFPGNTTLSAAAAAGQAVIALTADPALAATGTAIATNDWIVIRRAADGVARVYQVSSVSGLNVTLSANLATGLGLAAGDKVWWAGQTTTKDPRTGELYPIFVTTASTQFTLTNDTAGVVQGLSVDEPIMLQSNNATAAGVFTSVGVCTTAN
jgi:hypothetical protein